MSFDALRNTIEVVSVKAEATFKTEPFVQITGEVLTTTLGAVLDTLLSPNVKPLSFVATSDTARVATDNGQGLIIGDVLPGGTINYITGAVSFTFDDTVLSTSSTANYKQIGVDADVLYLAGMLEMNEAPEYVQSMLVTSKNTPNDWQNTFWAADLVFPLEVRLNDSSTSTFNFVGSNAVLLDNFFGDVVYQAQTTITVATSTTVFTVAAAGGRRIGDLICVKNTNSMLDSQYEVGIISTIAGAVITLASPGLSATPAVTDKVLATRLWSLRDNPATDPSTLWFNFFGGEVYGYQFGGQRVNQLEIGFPTGELITLQASTKGAGKLGLPSEIITPFTPASQSVTEKQPLVGVKAQLIIAGERTDCSVLSANVTLANEIHTPNTIDCDDTISKSIRGKYTIEGSFDEFVISKQRYLKFQGGVKGSVFLTAGNGQKNMMCVAIPRCHVTAVPMSEEGAEMKYSVSFNGEVPVFDSTRVNRAAAQLAIFGTES